MICFIRAVKLMKIKGFKQSLDAVVNQDPLWDFACKLYEQGFKENDVEESIVGLKGIPDTILIKLLKHMRDLQRLRYISIRG